MVRVAAVVLVDSRGRILLQERDEHAASGPEKWGLVGGDVEDGEDDESAAYRELAEETGVALASGSLACRREFRLFREAYGSEVHSEAVAARPVATTIEANVRGFLHDAVRPSITGGS